MFVGQWRLVITKTGLEQGMAGGWSHDGDGAGSVSIDFNVTSISFTIPYQSILTVLFL